MLEKCNKKCKASPFTNCVQECMTEYSKQFDHFLIREFKKICSGKDKISENFTLFERDSNENMKEQAEQMMETVSAYQMSLNKAIGLCVNKKMNTEVSYINKLVQESQKKLNKKQEQWKEKEKERKRKRKSSIGKINKTVCRY